MRQAFVCDVFEEENPMKHLKKTGFIAVVMLSMFFTACNGDTAPPSDRISTPPPNIGISPTAHTITVGNSHTFTVTPPNIEFSVNALTAAGCARSGNTVRCEPAEAGTYTVTVAAISGAAGSASATLTVNPVDWAVDGVFDHSDGYGTFFYGINSNGLIIGEFYDSEGNIRAFLKDGAVVSPISPPEAVGNVHAYGINDSGHILLYYNDGYFLLVDGVYQPLESHTDSQAHLTYYTGISNSGRLIGYFTEMDGYAVGFITDETRNFAMKIEHPDADGVCADSYCGTWINGINESGRVVGAYRAGDFFLGFEYDCVAGEFFPIEHPESRVNFEVTGINDIGQAVGYFWGDDGVAHGFLRDGGRFVELTHVDSAGYGVFAYGINNDGRIVGKFDDGEKSRGVSWSR